MMKQPAYLEFVELDDYCAHLAAHDTNRTHLEITQAAARPRGKFQVAAVTVYATATARIEEPEGDGHIACWSNVILQTSNINARLERDLPHDQQKGRQVLFKNFESVRRELEARGLEVTRGKWTFTTPNFLK
jgi:hypothetical protein